MKLESGRTESFLKNPSSSAILIHGPDAGLVAERALALARTVPGALDDPFRYAELHDPGPDAFLAEATAASLSGGQRVLRVRDAGDALAKPLESLLQNPPAAMLILEAGELTAKSRLRALAEKSPAATAIACYALDGAKIPAAITARLRAEGIAIDPDASAWIAQNCAPEEGPLRQTVELLTLYAGPEKKSLSLEDVTAALPDGGATTIQDAIDAALTGDTDAADRAVTLAYEDGTSPVALIRILLMELLRLRVAAGAVSSGVSPSQAIAALRPPVFFKRQPAVTRALSLWPPPALDAAIRTALAAETACKQTATPDHAYARQTFLVLATRARQKR